jgi:hypothetical protein
MALVDRTPRSTPDPNHAMGTTMAPCTTALVFATDETFAPLAKGLVLSTIAHAAEFNLFLIDIGCSDETRRWMAKHDVRIVPFDRKRHLRKTPKVELKRYQDAQLCRPYIPELIPDYDVYLWCDSDIWIQDISSLRIYRDIAIAQPDMVPISPLVDASYSYFYEDMSEFMRYSEFWYREAFGPTIASTYSNRAVLSSGLFAMHYSNPIWKAWASELEAIFQRPFSNHDALHLSEQVALNYLLYARKRFSPVGATHNYNCHIGRVRRLADERVVIDNPPHRTIGVVHLTYSSKMIGRYIDEGLLFDRGRYLSEEELNGLRMLAHY